MTSHVEFQAITSKTLITNEAIITSYFYFLDQLDCQLTVVFGEKKKEKCKDIWQGDFLSNQTDGVRRSFLKEAHTHKRKQLGTTSQKYFTFKMEICPVSGTIQIQCSKYKPLIFCPN